MSGQILFASFLLSIFYFKSQAQFVPSTNTTTINSSTGDDKVDIFIKDCAILQDDYNTLTKGNDLKKVNDELPVTLSAPSNCGQSRAIIIYTCKN